ncbi:DUF5124 domain-containing protein [Sphingobacterium siyangense]|jgi:hypothetical protein|uniref:DUF5124 domain-containing protein n=1 Tax=Sphingobacterium siyangense TaxID=459529 RepID=UPI003C78497F
MKFQKLNIFLGLIGLFCVLGCDPKIDAIGEDPYGGGREALGISLSSQAPSPDAAYPGDEVTFKAKGLLAWSKPEANQYEFEFYIANEKAKIKSATDTTITVIIPENVSSGITNILLKGQVFYGPNFTVLGNVKIDSDWGIKTGTNGPVFNYLEHNSQSRSYYLIGGFYTVDGKERSKLAYISDRGVLADDNSSRYNVSRPLLYGFTSMSSEQTVNTMSYFSNGQILLSGSYNAYVYNKSYLELNNITVLNNNLVMDTMMVKVQAWGTSTATTKIVPRFNGGALQPIIRSFVTAEGKVIAVGNINTYAQADYAKSTAIENVYNYKTVASVFRMEKNGNLDAGYRSGDLAGAKGITDAYMDAAGGIVVVGEFTKFDNETANRIVRLDMDGKIDKAFSTNIGSGANGVINMVRYNKNAHKLAIVGSFTSFNGKPRQGVAVLNEDGTLDETFVPKEILGGQVNFASILKSGKVVISGTFQKYEGVSRPGFLILDANGQSTQRFNVPGAFIGQLFQAVETLTTTGKNGLLLMGNFSRFNGQRIDNIVMLEADFD